MSGRPLCRSAGAAAGRLCRSRTRKRNMKRTDRMVSPFELVKKVFLTSSQTRSASLGSRLKKAACRCAHNLCANCAQIPHLRHVVCFARRTRRRAKRIHTLFRRARRNSTRFFDRLKTGVRQLADARFVTLSAFPALPASCWCRTHPWPAPAPPPAEATAQCEYWNPVGLFHTGTLRPLRS